MKFTDLHDKMVQSSKNLINREEFYGWLEDNITVKNYIPITEKYSSLSVFSIRFEIELDDFIRGNDNDISTFYMVYDKEKMFQVLFHYIDTVIIPKNRTFANYDLIFTSGLYDYLMPICGEDYDRYSKICDRVLGVELTSLTKALAESMAKVPSAEEMEKIKNIINSLDKDKMEILKVIEEYNNPRLKKLVDASSEVQKVMRDKNGTTV